MSDFTLVPTLDQTGAWSLADRPSGGLGERVGLSGVLGDLRRKGRSASPGRGASGFGWDRRDSGTREWWPQGLTTSEDSGAPLLTGASKVVLAAWYRRDETGSDKASRVSVVDLGPTGVTAEAQPSPPAYDHVLLVEADRDPVSRGTRHSQVRVHAGGLVWWGDLLLVADTRGGLRIFDLRDIVRVAEPTPDTHGCRFLLPQCGRWASGAAEGVRPLRWSFCSLDRTDPAGLSLVAGEYSHSGKGARLARFPLAEGDPVALGSAEAFVTDIPSMQGVVRVRGRYLVSASHGGWRRGHLWAGGPDGFTRHTRALPVGPEDLSLDRHTGRLWTQTEYPGRRMVVSVPAPRA